MSQVKFIVKGTSAVAALSGDIDQHTAKEIRAEIDRAIDEYSLKELTLDFAHVSFMDSSGVGLIMGRYKKIQNYGGRVRLAHLNRSCERIVSMSGITQVLDIKEDRDEN